jgi:hypothetical protein
MTNLFAAPDGFTALAGGNLTYFGPLAPWFWNIKGPFILMRVLPMFLSGICIYRLWQAGQLEPLANIWTLITFGVAVLLAMHLGLPRPIVVLSLILLTVTALGSRTISHPIFTHPVMYWLGNISLSLYLLHFPVLRLVDAISWSVGDAEIRHLDMPMALLLWWIVVVLNLALAHLGFHLVEDPARRWVRQGWRKVDGHWRQILPTFRSPRAPLVIAITTGFVLMCLPLGVLSQGFLLRALPREARVELEEVVIEARRDRLRAQFKVNMGPAEAHSLPLTVVGNNGWAAQTGDHRRNSVLQQPGSTFFVTLIRLDPDAGVPSLSVHLPMRTMRFELPHFSTGFEDMIAIGESAK